MRLLFFIITFYFSIIVNAQETLKSKITKFRVDYSSKYASPSYYEKDSLKLFGLRMIHVNKPEFYLKTKKTLDSLRNEGFVIFYEGVLTELENKEEADFYLKKFRRITHESLMNYFDDENEVNKSHKIQGYVYQNDADYGLNFKVDKLVDLSVKELILAYEKKFGEIILTDCDLNTPMGKKYKCSKKDKNGTDYLISTLRNNHIFDEIKNSKSTKIALVYGKAHIDVLGLMLKRDGWMFKHLN